MNFNPQDVASTKSQTIGASILQIEDLNNLIDSLKRREENIIQLLDYNLKYKNSSNHMDTIHLRGLYLQLHEREKKRIEQEELIIQKYTDLYVSDEYQKKYIYVFITL